MELELHRVKLTAKATLGSLFVDGEYECVTLEDVVRPDPNPDTPWNEAKVQDQTAIPDRKYRCIINVSPRLKKPYIRLLDVPGFDGILIHSGNTDIDTKGCILVGDVIDNDDMIHGGSSALPRLQKKVQNALDRGEQVWITITNDFLASAAA